MVREKFDRHTTPKKIGFKWLKVAVDNLAFCHVRVNDCYGFLRVVLLSHGSVFTLFEIPSLTFCIACGRFRKFGYGVDVCWWCEEELENFDE
jgi:hypothetical protein